MAKLKIGVNMYQVNIHEAKTNLSKLITKVVNGEDVVIAKGNKPIVKIVKFSSEKAKRKLGSADGQINISDDFDAPLGDFKEYMR
jgi:prevent-host-death family protein